MKRSEALALLKELRANFTSIEPTQFVLLRNPEKKGFWELDIMWVPGKQEKEKLFKLAKIHRLDLTFKDGKTTLRRST